MSESLPRGVRRAAADALAGRSKSTSIRIGDHRTLTSEKTGETLYQVFGSDPSKGNDAVHSVLLDARGAEADPKVHKLAAALKAPLAAYAELDPAAVHPVATAAATITISPTLNDLELDPGEVFEEVITVTVPPDTGVDKADVYFLADTTGSMTTVLNAVKSGASNILTSLNGLPLDLAFGVGQYKDFPSDPFAFDHQQSPTTNTAAATTAINAWTASGGGDTPEGQLFALDQLAEPSNAGTIGWRPNAKKIIVWFGDAPGHDPICQAISGLSYDITEGSATAKLVAESITVLAIGTTSGADPNALDGDPTVGGDYVPACGAPGGTPGQATRIAAATGGTYSSGIDETTIVNEIISLVTTAASQINNLRLVPTGATAPCVVSIDPAGGYGPLSGDTSHTLDFRVRIRGCKPCGPSPQQFTGTIDAVADGVVVARKRVIIRVPACEPEELYSYSVKYVCGMQRGEAERCAPAVAPGLYATDINLHNPDPRRRAVVRKHVIPLVYSGKPIGREPKVAEVRARDEIVLPPNTATMDDCCRIGELLFDGGYPSPMPLQVGFLQIVSTVELEVVAVYTANSLDRQSVSIDVERVPGRLLTGTRSPEPGTRG